MSRRPSYKSVKPVLKGEQKEEPEESEQEEGKERGRQEFHLPPILQRDSGRHSFFPGGGKAQPFRSSRAASNPVVTVHLHLPSSPQPFSALPGREQGFFSPPSALRSLDGSHRPSSSASTRRTSASADPSPVSTPSHGSRELDSQPSSPVCAGTVADSSKIPSLIFPRHHLPQVEELQSSAEATDPTSSSEEPQRAVMMTDTERETGMDTDKWCALLSSYRRHSPRCG